MEKNIGFKITITNYTINKMKEIEDFFLLHFPLSSRLYQPVMTDENDEMYVDFGYFLRKFYELKQYTPNKNVSCSIFKYEPSDRMCNLSIRNVIYPDLYVLACHRSNMYVPEDIIKKEFIIGYCRNGKIDNIKTQKDKTNNLCVDSIPACQDCYARYHCCGGYPTIKIMRNKDTLTDTLDYCDELKNFLLSTILNKPVCSYIEMETKDNEQSEIEFLSFVDRRLK